MAKKSIGKNIVLNVLNSALSILFPVITFAYASRTILAEGVGRVNYAKSFSEIFVVFATLGISTYGIREAAKVRDDKKKLSILIHEILIINFFTTALTYIVYFGVLVFNKATHFYADVLLVYSTTVLFTTIGVEWFYSAIENYRFIAIRKLIIQLLSLALLFVFVKGPDDYIIYAVICVFSNVGSNILNLIYLRKYIYFKRQEKYEIKKHLKSVFLLFGNNLAYTVHSNIDIIMIGALLTATSVGYYSAAIKINRMVRMLFSAASAVFLPAISNLLEHISKEEYSSIVIKGFNILLMFSIPASVGLFTLSKPILSVFCGREFDPALPTMILLTPIIAVTTITYAFHNMILIPMRKEKVILWITAAGILINVILNYLLILQLGEFGAALATLLTEIIAMIMNIIVSKNFFNVSDLFNNVIQYCIASVCMGFMVCFVNTLIRNDLLSVICGGFTGFLVYILLLLLMNNNYASVLVYKIKTIKL